MDPLTSVGLWLAGLMRGECVHRWNVFDSSSNTTDCLGHGSALASIAAGNIFGVAKAANVVGVKVLDCSGHGGRLQAS